MARSTRGSDRAGDRVFIHIKYWQATGKETVFPSIVSGIESVSTGRLNAMSTLPEAKASASDWRYAIRRSVTSGRASAPA